MIEILILNSKSKCKLELTFDIFSSSNNMQNRQDPNEKLGLREQLRSGQLWQPTNLSQEFHVL